MPNDSYTAKLFKSGVKRIAQKVGEEGVEVALAAMTNDADELINETCDLIYHTLVLLQAKKIDIMKISETLRKRMK
jgi:phosphoribosyl-ATP pyrophosphohydrolase/phosphoribosyl-AMP cyclohydrolase